MALRCHPLAAAKRRSHHITHTLHAAAVSLTVVMAAADAALYRAKRDGRDRSRVERVGDGV